MANERLSPQDYKDAVFTQTACNLSGIVFSFAKVMQKICNEANAQGHGTDWKNQHSICRLYAEQIAFLTSGKDWHEAYNECEEIGNTAK
jgi:hypothetical protein